MSNELLVLPNNTCLSVISINFSHFRAPELLLVMDGPFEVVVTWGVHTPVVRPDGDLIRSYLNVTCVKLG